MGWSMDECSKFTGFSPGVITCKPIHPFGSEGREEATVCSVTIALEELLKDQVRPSKDVTVALQGFGNFASFTARLKSGVERRLLPWVTTCVAFRGPTGSLSTHCAIGRRSIGLFKGYPAAQASTASKY